METVLGIIGMVIFIVVTIALDPALARGVNVIEGKITYEAVAEAHGLGYTPLEDVLRLSPV